MAQSLVTTLDMLLKELRRRQLTLGFGESCTGGLLSGTLARIPGVSDLFMGSLVTYSYAAKVDLLGVSWETLQSFGAVSEEVVREMSQGVCHRLKVGCSIAITGIAGPSGGTPEKPVGTVWFAVKGPDFEVAEKQVFQGERQAIQDLSVEFGLDLLLKQLKTF